MMSPAEHYAVACAGLEDMEYVLAKAHDAGDGPPNVEALRRIEVGMAVVRAHALLATVSEATYTAAPGRHR